MFASDPRYFVASSDASFRSFVCIFGKAGAPSLTNRHSAIAVARAFSPAGMVPSGPKSRLLSV